MIYLYIFIIPNILIQPLLTQYTEYKEAATMAKKRVLETSSRSPSSAECPGGYC